MENASPEISPGGNQVSEKCAYRGWVIVAVLLALSASPTAALADKKLSGSEIRATAPGEWSGRYKNVPLHLIIANGGKVNGRFAGIPRSGTWQVSGSQFCLTFRAIAEVKTKCGAVHLNGKTLYGFFTKRGKARLFLHRL
jgi:hypothetical protein